MKHAKHCLAALAVCSAALVLFTACGKRKCCGEKYGDCPNCVEECYTKGCKDGCGGIGKCTCGGGSGEGTGSGTGADDNGGSGYIEDVEPTATPAPETVKVTYTAGGQTYSHEVSVPYGKTLGEVLTETEVKQWIAADTNGSYKLADNGITVNSDGSVTISTVEITEAEKMFTALKQRVASYGGNVYYSADVSGEYSIYQVYTADGNVFASYDNIISAHIKIKDGLYDEYWYKDGKIQKSGKQAKITLSIADRPDIEATMTYGVDNEGNPTATGKYGDNDTVTYVFDKTSGELQKMIATGDGDEYTYSNITFAQYTNQALPTGANSSKTVDEILKDIAAYNSAQNNGEQNGQTQTEE